MNRIHGLAILVLFAVAAQATAQQLRDMVGVVHAGGGYTLKAQAPMPYFQELFARDFSTFLLVTESGKSWMADGMTTQELADERAALRDLAQYLLTTYAYSGKTFVFQNWEGDHHLRTYGTPPSATAVQGMRDWLNARQNGVNDARAAIGANGVWLLNAAEVNLVHAAIAGKVTMTNDVIPYTSCDLYSYSVWDEGNEFNVNTLNTALKYLALKAPDTPRLGARNLYLGEFGAGENEPEVINYATRMNISRAAAQRDSFADG